MAGPKSTIVFDERSLNDAAASSSIDGGLTPGGRIEESENDLRDLEVTVNSTTLNIPDHYENSLANATIDARNCSSTEKVIVSKGGVASKSPSLVIDHGSVSIGIGDRQAESQEQTALRLEKMQNAVRTLLECIGENPNRAGLLKTPSRYAQALLSLTAGYHNDVESIVNNALFNENHNEMVIVKNIDISSLCEHHLLPFTGKMNIGYIPSHTVIGLSKLPRIAEMFSRRLQIQERLTKDVASAIMEVLSPQGVAVTMECSHLCMAMRGVEEASATTLTSCMLGCFEGESGKRAEFMYHVGINR